jgi:hypothetical protein
VAQEAQRTRDRRQVAVGREVRRAGPGAAESVLVGKLPEAVTALGFDAATLYAGTEASAYRPSATSVTRLTPVPLLSCCWEKKGLSGSKTIR